MADSRWLPEYEALLGPILSRAKRGRTDLGTYGLWEAGRFDDVPTLDHIKNGMAYVPPGLAGSGLGSAVGGFAAGSAGLVPGMGISGAWVASQGIGAAGSGGLTTSVGIGGRAALGSGMGIVGAGSGGLGASASLVGAQLPHHIGVDIGYTGSSLNGRGPDPVGRRETIPMQGPHLLPPDVASTLFVEGLPSNCTLREASHVFRPFIGFKEVRLVLKEPKRPGGDKLLFCFVDFVDSKCAAVALEALQGYKFDEYDEGSSVLKLEYARFRGPRGGH